MPAMHATPPADILTLEEAFDAAERDARTLVAGLTEAMGSWRAEPGTWSVAECLDHLATANRVYLHAMQRCADRAVAEGRWRRGPATCSARATSSLPAPLSPSTSTWNGAAATRSTRARSALGPANLPR